jgi:Domain of unknown function (DUF4174)
MSKKRFLVTLAVLMLVAQAKAQLNPGCAVQPATLRAMRDCYRPVLVFAPTARDASFAAQQALLEQYADDMMDRNLLYVPVLAQSAQFQRPLDAPYVELKQSEMNAIRARFGVSPPDFVVVLVGKDGGEKFRTKKPISVLRLDSLVDAMPMGQQEKSARPAKSQ